MVPFHRGAAHEGPVFSPLSVSSPSNCVKKDTRKLPSKPSIHHTHLYPMYRPSYGNPIKVKMKPIQKRLSKQLGFLHGRTLHFRAKPDGFHRFFYIMYPENGGPV